MNAILSKPKLVFFQYRYDDRLPAFLLMHKREHVRCLSEFFDVIVVSEDCDFQQICDSYQPDLALFESGVPNPFCQRINITNVRACPEVPKLGFLHADAFCCARAGFLSDMDHWGIETFFAIATSAPEHIPTIADNLFIWPNCADTEIYRDYNQWKTIPVLFTGNKNSIYPWRQQIIRTLSPHYPSLICPHPGYSARRAPTQVMVGEPYARMINASWFVPACGTVAKEIVRKHFEIPACKACLVTERSEALEAAGFVDMVNCVFADDKTVLEKVDYLYQNQDALSGIINAGHQLVNSSHARRHRDQIFQWFVLQKRLLAHQKIIQAGPFTPLSIVDKSAPVRNIPIISGGEHMAALRQGDNNLWGGRYQEAERQYLKVLSYIPYMPEPKVRLCICSLYQGNANKALSWVSEPLQFTLAEYKAVDPDPVEWAYFVVAHFCLGNVATAVKRAEDFPWLHHPELEFVRRIVRIITKGAKPVPLVEPGMRTDRRSLHQLPVRDFNDWLEQLCIMLNTCGQTALVDAIEINHRRDVRARQASHGDAQTNGQIGTSHKEEFQSRQPEDSRSANNYSTVYHQFERRALYSKTKLALKRIIRSGLHNLENKYHYFLPYRVSAARKDEFFHAVEDLMQEETICSVLVIGASLRQKSTEALLAGARANKGEPAIFCVGNPASRSIKRQGRTQSPLSVTSSEWFSGGVEAGITKAKMENQIKAFDLILVDGSEWDDRAIISSCLQEELYSARFILLDDINRLPNNENHYRLLRHPAFALIQHNPSLRNGYSIFSRDARIGQTT